MKRYDICLDKEAHDLVEVAEDGAFVRYEDVLQLVASKQQEIVSYRNCIKEATVLMKQFKQMSESFSQDRSIREWLDSPEVEAVLKGY